MSIIRCPKCKSNHVHRSRRRNLVEHLALRPLLLRPYRCWTCNRRHYGSIFRRRYAPRMVSSGVFLGGARRAFEGASVPLLLLGIPVLLASSGPLRQTFKELGFSSPGSRIAASQDHTLAKPTHVRFDKPQSSLVTLEGSARSFSPEVGAASSRLEVASPEPQQPLGALRIAGEVYVNDAKVPGEVTIFVGDKLRTGPGGSAALEVPGKGTLLVSQQTQVSFQVSGGYFADLKLGSVSLRALADARNFEIQVGDYVVTPDTPAEAGVDIQRLADGTTRVKPTAGSVGVIGLKGPEAVFIRAGQEATISPDGKLSTSGGQSGAPTGPVASTGPQPLPESGPKKSNAGKWAAVGAGSATAAVVAVLVSGKGSSPAVSPSTPY